MFWWLHVLVFLIFCGIKSRSKMLITNIQIIIIVLFRRSKRDYFNMNTQLNLKLNSISRQKHSLISNNLFLTSTCCVSRVHLKTKYKALNEENKYFIWSITSSYKDTIFHSYPLQLFLVWELVWQAITYQMKILFVGWF